MARCPYGQHRLLLKEDCSCKHCGADLRLYAAVRDLPVSWYNEARRCWDLSNLAEASACLQAALKLRPDFPEAHWLLGLIEDRLGRPEQARHHLSRAQELGAGVNPDWVPVQIAAEMPATPEAALSRQPQAAPASAGAAHIQRPQARASGRISRRLWPAVAVAAGLAGLSIGMNLPRINPGNAPRAAELQALRPPAAGPPEDNLIALSRQALAAAEGVHIAELQIAQIGRQTVKVGGRASSLKEKVLIDKTLRAIPQVAAVDLGNLKVSERYVVRRGDTLWSLAVRWYRDSSQWQRIAAANAISAPRELDPGRTLMIPQER